MDLYKSMLKQKFLWDFRQHRQTSPTTQQQHSSHLQHFQWHHCLFVVCTVGGQQHLDIHSVVLCCNLVVVVWAEIFLVPFVVQGVHDCVAKFGAQVHGCGADAGMG